MILQEIDYHLQNLYTNIRHVTKILAELFLIEWVQNQEAECELELVVGEVLAPFIEIVSYYCHEKKR